MHIKPSYEILQTRELCHLCSFGFHVLQQTVDGGASLVSLVQICNTW